MYALIIAMAVADAVNDITYGIRGQHPFQTGENWGPYFRDKTIAMGSAGITAGAGAAIGAAVGPAIGAGTGAAGGAAAGGTAGGTTGAAAGATTGAATGTLAATTAIPVTSAAATGATVSGTAIPTVASIAPSTAAGTLSTPASVTATQAGTAGLTGLETASSSATGISPSVTSSTLNEGAITSFTESMKEIGSAGVEKAIGGAGHKSLEQGIKSLGTQSLFGTIQEGIPSPGSFLSKATTGNAYVDAFKNIGRESFTQSIKEAAPNLLSRTAQNVAAGATRGAISDRDDPGRGALMGGAGALAGNVAGGITRQIGGPDPGNYLLPEKTDSLMGEFGTQPEGLHIPSYGERMAPLASKAASGFTRNAIKTSMTPGLRRPDVFPYTRNPYYNKYAYEYA